MVNSPASHQLPSPNAIRNSVAINADVVRQLAQAPNDLRHTFRTEGYDGVVRWSARWADLCDTVLRVYSFGLMAEPTRQQALLACERCLGLNIPVDVITTQAERVISTLDPYNDTRRSSSSSL